MDAAGAGRQLFTSDSADSFHQAHERIETETETWDHKTKEGDKEENILGTWENGKGLKMM